MAVDYAILGVLIEQPTHGYSLKKYLLEHVSRSFGINDGQLYPALGRLEGRGWIHKRVVPQARNPAKHLYSVTPVGRAAFEGWLSGAEESARCDFFLRHEFLQRCAFFRHLPPEAAQRQIRSQIDEVEARLAELERVAGQLAARGTDPYRRMIAEFGVRHQRMWREWLAALLGETAAEVQNSPPAELAAGAH
jgi:DNA-binding PadR family transcriptional regulator